MRLLSRFQHNRQPEISATEVAEIQKRVHSMKERIGKRDVELADLFALVKEDERPVLREIQEVKRPEIQRFWPHQIPSTQPAAARPETPVYPNLRPFQPSSQPTAP